MLDERFINGVLHFNAREFYDAHEVWEDLWHEQQGEAHGFLQGLIQFATALHHFEASNLKGTKILYEGGVELLSKYPDQFWGLNLRKLLIEMKTCVEGILKYDVKELPGRYHKDKEKFPAQINPRLIPKLEVKNEN